MELSAAEVITARGVAIAVAPCKFTAVGSDTAVQLTGAITVVFARDWFCRREGSCTATGAPGRSGGHRRLTGRARPARTRHAHRARPRARRTGSVASRRARARSRGAGLRVGLAVARPRRGRARGACRAGSCDVPLANRDLGSRAREPTPVRVGREIAGADLASGGGWRSAQRPAAPRSPRRHVCKKLWSDPSVEHRGACFALDETSLTARPVQRPWPRLHLAGDSDAALYRRPGWDGDRRGSFTRVDRGAASPIARAPRGTGDARWALSGERTATRGSRRAPALARSRGRTPDRDPRGAALPGLSERGTPRRGYPSGMIWLVWCTCTAPGARDTGKRRPALECASGRERCGRGESLDNALVGTAIAWTRSRRAWPSIRVLDDASDPEGAGAQQRRLHGSGAGALGSFGRASLFPRDTRSCRREGRAAQRASSAPRSVPSLLVLAVSLASSLREDRELSSARRPCRSSSRSATRFRSSTGTSRVTPAADVGGSFLLPEADKTIVTVYVNMTQGVIGENPSRSRAMREAAEMTRTTACSLGSSSRGDRVFGARHRGALGRSLRLHAHARRLHGRPAARDRGDLMIFGIALLLVSRAAARARLASRRKTGTGFRRESFEDDGEPVARAHGPVPALASRERAHASSSSTSTKVSGSLPSCSAGTSGAAGRARRPARDRTRRPTRSQCLARRAAHAHRVQERAAVAAALERKHAALGGLEEGQRALVQRRRRARNFRHDRVS